jgi:hypothetical protein
MGRQSRGLGQWEDQIFQSVGICPVKNISVSRNSPAHNTSVSKNINIPAHNISVSRNIPEPNISVSRDMPSTKYFSAEEYSLQRAGIFQHVIFQSVGICPVQNISVRRNSPANNNSASRNIPARNTSVSGNIPARNISVSRNIPAQHISVSRNINSPAHNIPVSRNIDIPAQNISVSRNIPEPNTSDSRDIPAHIIRGIGMRQYLSSSSMAKKTRGNRRGILHWFTTARPRMAPTMLKIITKGRKEGRLYRKEGRKEGRF